LTYLFSHFLWMVFTVKEGNPLNPLDISLFCAVTVMLLASGHYRLDLKVGVWFAVRN